MKLLLRMLKGRKKELILLKYVFLAFIGFCAGAIIAGGLFDFIVMIGAVARIIGKTHTSHRIRLYEIFIILGGISGCLVSVYDFKARLGSWLGILYGLFTGLFLGCLIMSLTETLDGIPIVNRRFNLAVGLQYMIMALAAGKLAGALLFFWGGFY